jgi:hypothetical protein
MPIIFHAACFSTAVNNTTGTPAGSSTILRTSHEILEAPAGKQVATPLRAPSQRFKKNPQE